MPIIIKQVVSSRIENSPNNYQFVWLWTNVAQYEPKYMDKQYNNLKCYPFNGTEG